MSMVCEMCISDWFFGKNVKLQKSSAIGHSEGFCVGVSHAQTGAMT